MMRKAHMAHYVEVLENGVRDYMRLNSDGNFALQGEGTWIEKITCWADATVKRAPAAAEIAEELENSFQQELGEQAEKTAKIAAPIMSALAKLEDERGPILYGPSPELLEEMDLSDTDPGWQTEVGMGHLGKD